MKTPIKNKNFYHIEYSDIGISDQILIFYYSNHQDLLKCDDIFAGITTDFYIGDGIEDSLYSDTLTLKDTHILLKPNYWEELHVYGRMPKERKFATRRIPIEDIQIERKSNEQEILKKLGQKNEDYPADNNFENNSNQNNNLKINDFLIFTPRDSKMSLDDAMELWINSGTNNF